MQKSNRRTSGAASANKDFTKNLNVEALKGRRVGVLPSAAIGYRADGTPIGWVMTGKRFDDANLVRAVYALEQTLKAWRVPDLKKWK